jgi:hypothetical protein
MFCVCAACDADRADMVMTTGVLGICRRLDFIPDKSIVPRLWDEGGVDSRLRVGFRAKKAGPGGVQRTSGYI